MDDGGHVYENGAIAIDGVDIVLIGPLENVLNHVIPRRIINATGRVVMPGLINTHTHAAMTLFRGLADDMNFEPWLEKVWKMESLFATANNVSVGSKLAFIEMIKSGTTTAADMYWLSDSAVEAARRIGFRLISGPSIMDSVGPDGIPPSERETAARRFLSRYQDDPLIGTSIQVHSTYSVPLETLRKIASFVHEYDALFLTHVCESQVELDIVNDRYGMTPIKLLDSLGLLGPKTLLAHGIYLSRDEIQLLAERKTSIAHCPESNLKLGLGVAPIADMLAAGVNVSLGTDGTVTNNDLDVWGEMHIAALLQKGIYSDPTLIPALKALQMATIDGARALDIENKVGSLEVGKRADIILVNFDQPHLQPLYDVYSHLVYSTSRTDVETAIINGQIVMRDRQLLAVDEDAVKAEMYEIALDIKKLDDNVARKSTKILPIA